MLSEDPAAFGPFWGVAQRNIPIDILQQHIDPSLQNAEQVEQSVHKKPKILAGVIHHTQIDDKVPPIISASQRCVAEQKHRRIHTQYSERIKEPIK